MFKSWKTSLIGLGLGGGSLVIEALKAMNQGQTVNWTQVGLSLGIIALGAFSKDYDVTGSPKPPTK